MQIDLLTTPATVLKGRRLMESAYTGAKLRGHDARAIDGNPRPGALLMLYGLGGMDRLPLACRHLEAGGRFVAFDLGYWDRGGPHRKFRVSVGGFHCPDLIMRGPRPGAQRWMCSGLPFGNVARPDGHVLLIGNAPKSNAVGAAGWSARMSNKLKAEMPTARVIYRPKPSRPVESGVICSAVEHVRPIDDLLRGASLVVCRHSNVAVDACRLGIPVVCEDGAAASIYPRTLKRRDEQPTQGQRREFLHRLAWWQWSIEEVAGSEFWTWMEGILELR